MNVSKSTYYKNVSSNQSFINVGSGKELTIKELAKLIKETVGFKGEIKFDPSKLDGTPRKLLDSQLIFNLKFKPEIDLKEGLIKTYNEYLKINENN